MASIRVSNAVQYSGVHGKGWFFFVSAVKGLVS